MLITVTFLWFQTLKLLKDVVTLHHKHYVTKARKMKQILTLTTLAAILAFNSANAQQAMFKFGNKKTVAELSNSGWEFSNVSSVKNFIYVSNAPKQNDGFNVMATPYLNLKANDAVQIKYRMANAIVGVYTEDAAGKCTRICILSPEASSQNIIIPQTGNQRIIVKVEKSMEQPANLAINSVSFSNYNEMSYTTFKSKDMSIKKMQDTPDQLMEPAQATTSTDDSGTGTYAVKK